MHTEGPVSCRQWAAEDRTLLDHKSLHVPPWEAPNSPKRPNCDVVGEDLDPPPTRRTSGRHEQEGSGQYANHLDPGVCVSETCKRKQAEHDQQPGIEPLVPPSTCEDGHRSCHVLIIRADAIQNGGGSLSGQAGGTGGGAGGGMLISSGGFGGGIHR